ncbi:MAG: hypothetical protein C0408_07635 [Odoribacter sp.]|nr:hypothetical protein [Odoribacter sp.]
MRNVIFKQAVEKCLMQTIVILSEAKDLAVSGIETLRCTQGDRKLSFSTACEGLLSLQAAIC